MSKRPITVTLVGYLLIAAGTTGIIYHGAELKDIIDIPELMWVFVVRLLAIAGGVLTLRGSQWGRWLLLAWISYHVFLSIFHSTVELIIHIFFLIIVSYGLFNPKASAYFRKQ